MKLETHRNLKDNIPTTKKANYHIDPSAVVHITRILRNMYEDPVKAVVREYLANAIDAHNQAKQTKFVEVDCPTRMVPTFRVRDFGGGLCVEDVEKLLLGYGASGEHKRTSNEQIGGFGIGCKCAFAVSDTFTYVSWHDGKKQTWLCQLDDHDMGEAKLISHVPSDEPSGLMVEIPVSSAQLPLFEKHLKQIPVFFKQPIKISGKLFEPSKSINIKLRGDMAGQFAGTEWAFFALQDELAGVIDEDVIIVMGDLWYPVDRSFLSEPAIKDSRLIKIINRDSTPSYYSRRSRTFQCVIRAPIGTFSLAPTRESLQYDTATRKALKHAFSEIENNIHTMSQKDVDAMPTIWQASEKALELQNMLMYQTGRSSAKQPTFWWRGVEYPFDTAVGIDAETDTSGADIILAIRDLRNGANQYNRSTPGNLKVRHFKLNAPLNLPDSGTSTAIRKDGVPRRSITVGKNMVEYYGTAVGPSYVNNAGKHAVVYAITENKAKSDKVLKYVFPFKVPVFTLSPKDNAEFYTRRYLISEDAHAPNKNGFALVVQGTPEQQRAVFKKYPWLKEDVQELPLIKVVKTGSGTKTSTGTGRSFKSADNMFKFTTASLRRPSDSWEALEELPATAKYFVYLDKFVPTHRSPKSNGANAVSLSPGSQFPWYEAVTNMLRLLEKEDLEVYGFRVTESKQNTPGHMLLASEVLDAKLKDWLSPAALGKYKIHGYNVLLRFGPDGLDATLGITKDILDLSNGKNHKNTNNWYHGNSLGLELLRLFRSSQLKSKLSGMPDTSVFKQTALTYRKLIGLDTATHAELERHHEVLRALRSFAISASEVMCKVESVAFAGLKAYVKPLQELMNKTWDTYSVLDLLEKIPDSGDELDQLLTYIKLVDEK